MKKSGCEIRFFDGEFNWLGRRADASSVQFRADIFGGGSFEIHLGLGAGEEISETAGCGNLVIINGDETRSGVITSVQIKSAGSEVVLSGVSCARYILSRRVILPIAEKITAPAESMIRRLLEENLTNPSDERRRIELETGENLARGAEVTRSFRYQNLYTEIRSIAEEAGLGFRIRPDVARREWRFEITDGTDRTLTQGSNPPVVFSTDYKNILSYTYTQDLEHTAGTVYAAGLGSGVYVAGEDIRGLNRSEAYISSAVSGEELKKLAEAELSVKQPRNALEASVAWDRVFRYGDDYKLGDWVTVFVRPLGVYLNTRVTAMYEVYESNFGDGSGYALELTFGDKSPGLIERLLAGR